MSYLRASHIVYWAILGQKGVYFPVLICKYIILCLRNGTPKDYNFPSNGFTKSFFFIVLKIL